MGIIKTININTTTIHIYDDEILKNEKDIKKTEYEIAKIIEESLKKV